MGNCLKVSAYVAYIACFVMIVYLWITALTGCSGFSNQEWDRLWSRDYGACWDVSCGDDEERYYDVLGCMCDLHPLWDCSSVPPMPEVIRAEDDAHAHWLGARCSWIECPFYGGLCKGTFSEPATVTVLERDDKALDHEYVHYILFAFTGDGGEEGDEDFFVCGFPRLWC